MTFLQPVKIGTLSVKFPVALGPMAGVTDAAYREIAASCGCGMFTTEMVSAKALHYHNKNTELLLQRGESEYPVGVQLFGSDPDIIAEEALKLEERFEFIDFNMGCPVPKVVKNGEGSALLHEPEQVEKIFSRLVRTVHKPVTVKIRKGFGAGEECAPEIARILEACGVSAVAVHARTREQYYTGHADWDTIRRVKEAASIPVIGNGDVTDGRSAKKMLERTGCNGVMVARAAEGNPWVFREIRHYLETGETLPRPSLSEIKEMILRHAALLADLKGEHLAVLEMRKHAAWYLKGIAGAAALRREISSVTTREELSALLDRLQEGC